MATDNLQVLANYLTQTLSPEYSVRKPAEEYLISVKGSANFTMLLLQIAESEHVDMTIRLAAAINFKNVVKRNWRIIDEHTNKIAAADREVVKRVIPCQLNMEFAKPPQIYTKFGVPVTISKVHAENKFQADTFCGF